MSSTTADQPFLVVTALHDSGARAATLTQSHGTALERAYTATTSQSVAGIDLVELPVTPAAFDALRRAWKIPADTVGVYEVFPVAAHLDSELRQVAGQFLAAEKVWEMEEKGLLGGAAVNVRLSLPKGWTSDPKAVHQRLVDAGALDLGASSINTFNQVKTAWDASGTA